MIPPCIEHSVKWTKLKSNIISNGRNSNQRSVLVCLSCCSTRWRGVRAAVTAVGEWTVRQTTEAIWSHLIYLTATVAIAQGQQTNSIRLAVVLALLILPLTAAVIVQNCGIDWYPCYCYCCFSSMSDVRKIWVLFLPEQFNHSVCTLADLSLCLSVYLYLAEFSLGETAKSAISDDVVVSGR